MTALHLLVFLLGFWLVLVTLYSAIKTLVLPRSASDRITLLVFLGARAFFLIALKRARSFLQRDRILAYFAPVSLLVLLPVWLALVLIGYTGIFWSLGALSWAEAFRVSGSSLLTLGFAATNGTLAAMLEFSEAAIGLILVALLIAYLPTMYSAFSRRESAVTLLEVRAGDPPSAVEMLLRFHRIHGLDRLVAHWQGWESWFADIEESHTSLPALVFFRSPQPNHSWITAAGAVLDGAAIYLSAIDVPTDPQAALCIRAGYLSLRRIADFFNISYPENPHFPGDSISILQQEFEQALGRLESDGVALKADRQQAWLDFAGWRVNYDQVLIALASLIMAPESPWSGDRAGINYLPPVLVRH